MEDKRELESRQNLTIQKQSYLTECKCMKKKWNNNLKNKVKKISIVLNQK